MGPNRTILSVPGHSPKMHAKAATCAADVIMLDLEDSVPLEQKTGARARVIQTLQQTDFGSKRRTLRINGFDTPFGYQDLLEVAETCGHCLDAVVIPKVSHEGDIHFAQRLLDGIELAKGFTTPIRIEASIETAQGLDRVSKIARTGNRLYSLVFGIVDYQVSVGARLASLSGHGDDEEEIYPGHRWHFPLSRMVMAAKANGLLAIDAPFGSFRDQEGLKVSALQASALGCDGKWVIHPDQIAPVNQVFTPSGPEIRRAKTVLDTVARAGQQGLGAVAVEGRMVDQATLRLARQTWDLAIALGLATEHGPDPASVLPPS